MFTTLADGWVEVGLSEGKVIVYVTLTQTKNTRIDISSGELSSPFHRFSSVLTLKSDHVLAGSSLNDGQWHSVHLNVLENHAMLTVDGDEASTVRTAIPVQIQTGGTYYFGGDARDVDSSFRQEVCEARLQRSTEDLVELNM